MIVGRMASTESQLILPEGLYLGARKVSHAFRIVENMCTTIYSNVFSPKGQWEKAQKNCLKYIFLIKIM